MPGQSPQVRPLIWCCILVVLGFVAASCSAAASVDGTASAALVSEAVADGKSEDTTTDLGAEGDSASSASDIRTADEESAAIRNFEVNEPFENLIDGWSSAGASPTEAPMPAPTAEVDGAVEDAASATEATNASGQLTAEEILGVEDVPSASGGFIAHTDSSNCDAPPTGELTDPPEWVTTALEAAVNHSDFNGLDVSVSVWIDGWGEVVTRDPDMALLPASNEKILVAHAANELIDPTSTIETSVEQVGADLVFRAGGDPTFSTWRADQLIGQIVESGITSAERLVIDVSRFPQPPAASGWQSWQIRNFVGPLSGFMLDDNRWNVSDEFLEAPALINGQWLADRLRIAGVAIGEVEIGTAPPGQVVAVSQSEPIGGLVRTMMLASDNQVADLLTMQLGLLNGSGTLDDGIAEIDAELAALCVPLAGVMDDGSGLSRGNFRSAREFQEILRAIRETDTAEVFASQLPIGGVSGTLRGRFGGDAGRVQAKTGTIFGGRALSGYATTDSGRDVVFSILINGERERTSASLGAMDALVRTFLRS